MVSKKRLLLSSKLYLILDTNVKGYNDLLKILKEAVNSGVDIIQLRDKHASARNLLSLAKCVKDIIPEHIPFIMNDHCDVALAAGCDGVHLGQEDLPLSDARIMLPKEMIIGISAQTLEHAQEAQSKGADYIGFGSVFKTLTKPERDPMDLGLLKKVLESIQIPVFPIGGINQENIEDLKGLNVKRIAVTRAILEAHHVKEATASIKEKLEALDNALVYH